MLELAVAGTPYEIGQQHGNKASALIQGSLDFYTAKFARVSKLEWEQVRELALTKFAPVIGERWPDYMQEMRGIADGCERPLSDIIALNVRTEIAFGSFSDGCTALAWKTGGQAQAEAEGDGDSFLAQNWDWEVAQKPNLILLTITQINKPTVKMVTEAGIIGKIGLNSAGVGVCLNAIRVRGLDAQRIPTHLALRLVLDSDSRASALAALQKYGVASSCHILVADGTGATGLEFSHIDYQSIKMDAEGKIVHTNHYVKDHGPTISDAWAAIDQDTRFRLKRAGEILATFGDKPTFEQVQGLFVDDQNSPAAICRSTDDPIGATLFNIVMDLKHKKATVLEGLPSQPEARYELAF